MQDRPAPGKAQNHPVAQLRRQELGGGFGQHHAVEILRGQRFDDAHRIERQMRADTLLERSIAVQRIGDAYLDDALIARFRDHLRDHRAGFLDPLGDLGLHQAVHVVPLRNLYQRFVVTHRL